MNRDTQIALVEQAVEHAEALGYDASKYEELLQQIRTFPGEDDLAAYNALVKRFNDASTAEAKQAAWLDLAALVESNPALPQTVLDSDFQSRLDHLAALEETLEALKA